MPIIGVIFAYVSKWMSDRVFSFIAKVGYSTALAVLSEVIIVLQMTVVGLTIYIVIWIFRTIQEIFDFVDVQVSGGGASVETTFIIDVIKSLGLWDGFIDAFNLASPIFLAIFTLKLTLVGLKFLNNTHTIVSRHINIALSHGI